MPDRLSTVPTCTIEGVVWTCYITNEGHRYIYRSPGGRGKVGRMLGQGVYWAQIDNEYLGSDFKTLADAMRAASAASRRGKKAA